MKPPVILVLRGDDAFSVKLRENGFEVLNLELIKPEPLDDLGELRERLAELDNFDGLFFTSPVAATIFVDESNRLGQQFFGKIYVLGERTKTIFENAGEKVEYGIDTNTAEEMIESFGEAEFAGKRLLFVRGDKSMRTIPELLDGKASVEELVVYRTVENPHAEEVTADIRTRLDDNEIDWVCFFSPSAVETFVKAFERIDFDGIKMAAIGQTTARRAKEAGLKVEFISNRASAEIFAAGLMGYIKNIG